MAFTGDIFLIMSVGMISVMKQNNKVIKSTNTICHHTISTAAFEMK
jgi:hypothetical protein